MKTGLSGIARQSDAGSVANYVFNLFVCVRVGPWLIKGQDEPLRVGLPPGALTKTGLKSTAVSLLNTIIY